MEKETILLIEDDAFLAKIYSQTLEDAGYRVAYSTNGEEGLKLVARDEPVCILLDILLPGMDGFEVLEALKGEDASKYIPVLMLTNLGQREDVERAMKLGAAGYMIKAHALPQDIVRKIKEVCTR